MHFRCGGAFHLRLGISTFLEQMRLFKALLAQQRALGDVLLRDQSACEEGFTPLGFMVNTINVKCFYFEEKLKWFYKTKMDVIHPS